MSDVIKALLTRNLFAVFGERDGESRRAVIREIFTENARFSDPDGNYTGHGQIEELIVALHGQFPGFVFTARGPAQAINDGGRLEWGFGPPGEPPVVTGADFIIVEDGRIASLYTFLDPVGEGDAG